MTDRSTGCTVLHVDMDAFFASVVLRDRPELVGLPVVIGGSERGVVLCATYPARAHGVHSGMPMRTARRLCPGAIVVPPGGADFSAVSAAVLEVFGRFTPRVEAASLDEAYLDVRGAVRRLGSPLAIAEQLRAQVYDEQRITCSVGVATSRSVAKVASRRAKPDGVVVVPPDRVTHFLHPLDVGDLHGVGPATRARLVRLGIETVGELARTPAEVLRHALGPHAGGHVLALAWGRDSAHVRERPRWTDPDRSIGAEETFGRDTADRAVIRRELLRLSVRVASRARAARLVGRTVSLKVRYSDFTTLTRSRTLPDPTDITGEIHETALSLLEALDAERSPGVRRPRLRLVGVRISALVDRVGVHRQLSLGDKHPEWRAAEGALDDAVRRFGRDAVRPAALVRSRRP